ncbi:glycosyltransferase family 4 protein [uncultured Parabacteroides sp.]|uniref:glycosyltransferase family 4 protein n=1 Tax=uncultured Parabacteroides sp. TaxID=512312 RepID=UPI00260F9517|nr:glycosyltransferase family 4 protein [uncultured Parabacteroides sp.]
MKIWLIRYGENLPIDGENPRMQRMGLLANKLSDLGIDVTWWTSTLNHYNNKTYRYHNDTDVKVNEHLLLKLIHSPYRYTKNVSVRRLFFQWHIAYKFYRFALKEEKPDLILCAMPILEFLYFTRKYAKKMNIPYVVDVRDLNPDVFISPFSGVKRSIVKIAIKPLQWILSKGLNNAKGICATSEPYLSWALNYARRSKNKNDNVFYVAYPDCNLPDKLSDNSRWSKYENYTGITCCFFGQFGKIIDYDTIIETAGKCKDTHINVKFLLCGSGELFDYYKNIVSEKNLDNVILPGWVDQKDIRDIGYISDAGLMSYKPNEAFNMQMPNKFSEYLALGLAILLQPVGIMKEKIEDNKCGLHYENTDELFEILKYLSTHKEELNTMKSNSRLLFEKSFTASVVYENYANYLINLIKSK